MHDTIVWLNGAFGVGKTTTSHELVRVLPGARIFDPEVVGRMLRMIITEPSDDFQDWPAWRALVAQTAIEVHRHYQRALIAPMTLLRQDYAGEIFSAIAARGIAIRHVVLHADAAELARRIAADRIEITARAWRIEHLAAYRDALGWLGDHAEIVDTTALSPQEVARRVAALLAEPPRAHGRSG